MRRIKSEDVMGYSVLELGMEVTNCVVASQLSSMHEWNTGMYSILLQVNLPRCSRYFVPSRGLKIPGVESGYRVIGNARLTLEYPRSKSDQWVAL